MARIATTIVLLVTSLSAATAQQPGEMLEGVWAAQSRSVEADPGTIFIERGKISFEGCNESTFELLHDNWREDAEINPVAGKVQRYRDVAIRVKRTATCTSNTPVMRFLLSGESRCLMRLLLYRAVDDLRDERYPGWGFYSGSKC
jgi:hypothetical protein